MRCPVGAGHDCLRRCMTREKMAWHENELSATWVVVGFCGSRRGGCAGACARWPVVSGAVRGVRGDGCRRASEPE